MGKQLIFRMAGAYFSVLCFGTMVLIFNNKIILGIPLAQQVKFVLIAILVGDILIFLLLMLFTLLRLKSRLTVAVLGDENERLFILPQLLQFPTQLFWGMLVISLLFSTLFHIAEWLVRKKQIFSYEELVQLGHTLLAEQLIALTLAMLLYSIMRKLLRPYIAKLKLTSLEGVRYSSMLKPLLITFSSLLLLILLNMYRYVVYTLQAGLEPKLATLVLIASVYFSGGILLFSWHLRETKANISLITEGIQGLLAGERTRMHDQMPIFSNDEVGQLTTIFNQLQAKISKDYVDLEKERQVAFKVQKKLLLAPIDFDGGDRPVANPFLTEEGTFFYDRICRAEREFLLKGYISSKGMPAALLISALLVLFRTEMNRGEYSEKVEGYLQEILSIWVKELALPATVEIRERNG